MVGEKGLEPSHLSILVPKTSASTNSAIRPEFKSLYILLPSFVKIKVPSYKYNQLPKNLKLIPVTTPGSRFIK